MYVPSTTPSPPGRIGIAAITLARPNATISASTLSVPPKARRNIHSDAMSNNQLSVAQNTTTRSSWRSLTSSSTRSPTWRRTAANLSSLRLQLAGDPARRLLGASLAVGQSDHEHRRDAHDDHADDRGEPVQRVDATDRDRDDEPEPEDDVQHDRRADAGGGECEAGVRAADPRQREQAVAERRAGRVPAGDDVRQRLGAQLDAEDPGVRQPVAGRAERRAGEERVAGERR